MLVSALSRDMSSLTVEIFMSSLAVEIVTSALTEVKEY